mmetsp:Transcript_8404/g.15204  ORF Transcript_8404/g.15204 Transcript_8404/m.15204 type:complete len:406 (-) Transcript_8404:1589-2806(-)
MGNNRHFSCVWLVLVLVVGVTVWQPVEVVGWTTIVRTVTSSSRTKNSGLPFRSSQDNIDSRRALAAGFVNRLSLNSHARSGVASSLYSTATSSLTPVLVKQRIEIDEEFPGLERVHADPDVFVLHGFLDDAACDSLVQSALESAGGLERSPVAYAGWTTDVKDLMELAAKGPVSWGAIVGAWWQTHDDTSATVVNLVTHALQNYAVLLGVAALAIGAFTKVRANQLQQGRTSTSTTLDQLAGTAQGTATGTATFVRRAAALFQSQESSSHKERAALFEAPTVIRYEPGQVLQPHYDANPSADQEDANRGGQTLATLIVYLNDVEQGGLTRFGKLFMNGGTQSLTIQPKKGDALLFFPADAQGTFDERTEHEGCPAVDEKWIARIWRHKDRVPPPFGLDDQNLSLV